MEFLDGLLNILLWVFLNDGPTTITRVILTINMEDNVLNESRYDVDAVY